MPRWADSARARQVEAGKPRRHYEEVDGLGRVEVRAPRQRPDPDVFGLADLIKQTSGQWRESALAVALVGDPTDVPATVSRTEVQRALDEFDAFMDEEPSPHGEEDYCLRCDRVRPRHEMRWLFDIYACESCTGGEGSPALWADPWETEGSRRELWGGAIAQAGNWMTPSDQR